MFNFKVSGIFAGAAFIVSFLLGLLSGSSMPILVVRPLIFALLFFVISCIVYMAVSRFLPELLDGGEYGQENDFGIPGSRVNISEGGRDFSQAHDIPAIPGRNAALADDSEENLGDISALSNKMPAGRPPGLDQNADDGYNTQGVPETFSPHEGADTGFRTSDFQEAPDGESFSPAAAGGSVDILPDLDSLAQAFLPSSGGEGGDTVDYSTPPPAKKPYIGGKGQKMEGDFNPKDLAAGLRTVLNKD